MKYSATTRLSTQEAPISSARLSSVTGPTETIQGMVTTTMGRIEEPGVVRSDLAAGQLGESDGPGDDGHEAL